VLPKGQKRLLAIVCENKIVLNGCVRKPTDPFPAAFVIVGGLGKGVNVEGNRATIVANRSRGADPATALATSTDLVSFGAMEQNLRLSRNP
jgi:hypothetical protein